MPAGFKLDRDAARSRISAARRKTIPPLLQIGVILEKFHACGWTVPISPTYCPDERISSTDDDIERQGVWQHQGNSIDRFVGLSAFFALR